MNLRLLEIRREKIFPLGSAVVLSLMLTGCLTAPSSSNNHASFIHYGQAGGAQSVGMHTVLSGDTVYNVAQRYNLALQDVINANNLQAPYALSSGTRLRLTPPQSYSVKEGDTVESVSRMFNVSASQMSRLNNLSAPYRLSAGQSLRLPPAIKMPPPLMTSATYAQARQAQISGSGNTSSVYNEEPVYVPSAPTSAVEREVLSAPAPVTAERLDAPVSTSASASTAAASADKAVEAATTKVPSLAGGKFLWPVDGPVISRYGPKADGRSNDGINIKVAKGTPVKAAENGVVVYSGNELQGYGNLVLIRHADRWMTAYAHMDSVVVRKDMTINQGQIIGTVGMTGGVEEPQLHFEIRRGTDALNPELYLARQGS